MTNKTTPMSASASNDEWEIVDSRYLVDDPWLKLRSETVRLPNGVVLQSYHMIEYPDWVNVVALTTDLQIVLVEQYRHAAKRKVLEFPAGAADHVQESHLDAIKRELLEETGYASERWQLLGTAVANAARQNNRVYSYLALDAQKVADQKLDEGEIISIRTMPWREFRAGMARGEIELPGLQLTCLYWLEVFVRKSSDPTLRQLAIGA